MDVVNNTFKSIKVLFKNPGYIIIGLNESLLFSMLHIFIFLWFPLLKEQNSNTDSTSVFTILMMSLMVGGAGFRV